MLLAGACSEARRDNNKAAGYADRLEQAGTLTAQEYAEIVDFYCEALDRAFAELEPTATEYAEAVDNGDTERAEKASRRLTEQVASTAAGRKDLTRLGTQLTAHLHQLPDSTRTRLLQYIASISTRYSDHH